MRHADLLREATNGSDSRGSVSADDTAVWYLVWVYGQWPCGCVFGGGMSDAIG